MGFLVYVDEEGFVQQASSELKLIWEESPGYNPTSEKRLQEIDAKIAGIRKPIEVRLADTGRMRIRRDH